MTCYDGWMIDYRDLDDKDLIEMRLHIDAELKKRGMRIVEATTQNAGSLLPKTPIGSNANALPATPTE